MGWQFSTQLIHRLDYRDRCSQMLNSLTFHVSPEKQSSLEKFIYLQNEHFHLVFLFLSCKSTTFNQLNKPTRRTIRPWTLPSSVPLGQQGTQSGVRFFMNQFQILISTQNINQQSLIHQLFNQLWLYTLGNRHKLKCPLKKK